MARHANHRAASETLLQFGVVGFGKLGLLQAAQINALPGCRLAAIADNASNVLSVFQNWRPDIACYSTHTEMLRGSKLDAVLIATPTHLHIPIAVDCLKAGIPLFIEKPLSLTAAQAQPLVDALKKNPVPVMVGYMNRFADTYRAAHQAVHSGVLGKPQNFRATMYIGQILEKGKGWRYDKDKAGGGVLITQNSHLLDLLLWLFGDVEWVTGQMQSLYSKEVEDSIHCYLSFKNGMTGWMDTSWSARHHRVLTTSLEVQTERGSLHVSDDEVRLFLDDARGDYAAGWNILKKPDLYAGVTFDVAGPHFTRQLEQFVRSLRGEEKIASDVASAIEVQKLIDAIYLSAEDGGHKVSLERSHR